MADHRPGRGSKPAWEWSWPNACGVWGITPRPTPAKSPPALLDRPNDAYAPCCWLVLWESLYGRPRSRLWRRRRAFRLAVERTEAGTHEAFTIDAVPPV